MLFTLKYLKNNGYFLHYVDGSLVLGMLASALSFRNNKIDTFLCSCHFSDSGS